MSRGFRIFFKIFCMLLRAGGGSGHRRDFSEPKEAARPPLPMRRPADAPRAGKRSPDKPLPFGEISGRFSPLRQIRPI